MTALTLRDLAFLNSSESIVTNGLVLNLDAGNTSSYSGSGTSWIDLGGNGNNGTLRNGPAYSSSNRGSLVFNGTSNYVTVPTSSLWNFGLNDFTIDMWIYPTSYSGSPTLLVIPPYNSASPNGIIFYLTGGRLSIYTTTEYPSNVLAPLNIWTHCVYTRTSGILNYYAQNVAGSTTNLATYSIVGSQPVGIGFDTAYGVDYFIGNIAVVKIYNKSLSSAEVTQNFNALRGRYSV